MGRQVRGMLALQGKGSIVFDYGNNIRAQAKNAGVEEAFNIQISSGTPKISFADAPSNGARIFIVYLGRQLLVAASANSAPHFDQFSGNGSTTTFALTQTPVTNTANNFIVFVDNVYQRLGSGLADTISGSNIVFSSAPPSGTNNIQVTQLARANTLNTVADGSISLTKMSFDPADDATALAIALG